MMLRMTLRLLPEEAIRIQTLENRNLLRMIRLPKNQDCNIHMKQQDFPCLLSVIGDTTLLTLTVQEGDDGQT